MNRTLFDYSGLIITSLGTAFGILGVYLTVDENPDFNKLQWILISISSLCLILVVFFLYMNNKNKRYKKSYKLINKAFAKINELTEVEGELNDSHKCMKAFEHFCSFISDAFTLITSRKCSVCIKLFELGKQNEVCTITYCRDSDSVKNDNRVNPDEDDTIHYLKENTDFKYTFENVDKKDDRYKYFFSNRLPFQDFYLNTRIDTDKYPPKCSTPVIKELIRLYKWPLPYKSTISVPITLFSNKNILDGKIAGFLCVDSGRLGSFNKKSDVEILRGISDGIYSALRKVNERHYENVHKHVKSSPKKKTA